MNNKKQIFGWAMYDWANSAFITTVTVAVLPIYFAGVVVGEEGVRIGNTIFKASSLWGLMLSGAAFLVFLSAPVLGAIADFSSAKKKFLMTFCYSGSLAGIMLYFCSSGDVWKTIIFFVMAQAFFVSANVFYDAFLPHIASDDKLDWVSGKGFAYGYSGGGLQLAISIVLISKHDFFGITEEHAARIAMAMAALWWAGFSFFTLFYLKEAEAKEKLPEEYKKMPSLIAYIGIGFQRTISTAKKVKNFKHLLMFLIAFMIYNDGIQTVINMAAIYGKEELHFSSAVLMLILLIIQFVALFGALIFGKLGEMISAKKALIITLCLWSFVVIYAYYMNTVGEFFFLGVIVGIVMGGSQSLSRSLYGSMIPVNASAEFYGFYSVFSKFSAIWGPLVFSIIGQLTGSLRLSILSLIFFFVIGLTMLIFVNVDKAKEAKMSDIFS